MTPPGDLIRAHTLVIDTRLDALEDAIRARDWEQTEFQFDRVLRATAKLIRLTDEVKP
jgi:hypothetical protein